MAKLIIEYDHTSHDRVLRKHGYTKVRGERDTAEFHKVSSDKTQGVIVHSNGSWSMFVRPKSGSITHSTSGNPSNLIHHLKDN